MTVNSPACSTFGPLSGLDLKYSVIIAVFVLLYFLAWRAPPLRPARMARRSLTFLLLAAVVLCASSSVYGDSIDSVATPAHKVRTRLSMFFLGGGARILSRLPARLRRNLAAKITCVQTNNT
jgi:peptidoglycan/LPS O-acetylase OafA/YrhL